MTDGDGLLYDGEHIFYCVTHGAIQRVDPVDKCVVTMSGGHRAACEFVDAVVGGRVVTIDYEAAKAVLAEAVRYIPATYQTTDEWVSAVFAAAIGVREPAEEI